MANSLACCSSVRSWRRLGSPNGTGFASVSLHRRRDAGLPNEGWITSCVTPDLTTRSVTNWLAADDLRDTPRKLASS
jgi:hypothetical protein